MSHVDLTVLSLVRINTESIVFGGASEWDDLGIPWFFADGKKPRSNQHGNGYYIMVIIYVVIYMESMESMAII
jgi:hypothetical protein